jgi:ATP/maltotriose-dependent transcriptional regulator MalT
MTQVLLAAVRLWRGHAAQSVTLAEEARATFRELDDPWAELQALLPLSRALVAVGRIKEGQRAIGDARSLVDRVPDPSVRLLASMYAAQVAVTIGDVKGVLREMESIAAEVGENEFVDDAERLGLRGLGRLLDGDVDGAVADLETARGAAETVSRWAFVGGALALALLGAGRIDEASEVAASTLESAITYLDELFAAIALAIGEARRGDPDAARRRASAFVAAVDATDDVVAQTVARLAQARILEAVGDDDGRAVLDDARARCRELRIRPGAWDALFTRLLD